MTGQHEATPHKYRLEGQRYLCRIEYERIGTDSAFLSEGYSAQDKTTVNRRKIDSSYQCARQRGQNRKGGHGSALPQQYAAGECPRSRLDQ